MSCFADDTTILVEGREESKLILKTTETIYIFINGL